MQRQLRFRANSLDAQAISCIHIAIWLSGLAWVQKQCELLSWDSVQKMTLCQKPINFVKSQSKCSSITFLEKAMCWRCTSIIKHDNTLIHQVPPKVATAVSIPQSPVWSVYYFEHSIRQSSIQTALHKSYKVLLASGERGTSTHCTQYAALLRQELNLTTPVKPGPNSN